MSTRLHTFRDDTEGATLIEFSLIMGLLFLITFSIIEFALVFGQFNNAQKATQEGARLAATRTVIEGVQDCGVNTNLPAGTDCTNVPGASSWTIVCPGSGGGGCNATGVNAVVDRMRAFYPQLDPADVTLTYRGTGLGYVGRNKPVPAITVRIANLTYDYVAVGQMLAFLSPGATFAETVNIDDAQTTIIAEDINDGAFAAAGG